MKKINWKKVHKNLRNPIIVKFWDHASKSTPILCNVIGFLFVDEDLFIQLVTWDCPSLYGDDRLCNMEYVSILKSTITDIKYLGEKKK